MALSVRVRFQPSKRDVGVSQSTRAQPSHCIELNYIASTPVTDSLHIMFSCGRNKVAVAVL